MFATALSPLILGAVLLSPPGVPDPDAPLSDARPSAPDWPIFRGNPALDGVAQGELPEAPELLWTFEAGGALASSPVVEGERVFVGSDDGNVYALARDTGQALWSFKTEDLVEAAPLVAGGRVYVGSHDFFLYALDAATGELVWKRETDDKIVGGANLLRTPEGELRVVVGSYDSNVYCFDAATGADVWRYATDNYVNGTPTVVGEQVVFGGCDAGLHIVSGRTGEQVAKVELGADAHVAGSAGARGGRVFVGHYGNAFVCFDIEQREVVWSYPSRQAFFSSPAITAERVVFGGRDKRLHCADAETGEPLWSFRTRRKVDGSPVICGERVLFGTADGRVHILELETGEERWMYDLGSAVLASPAVSGGEFFVGATDGRLYAFGAKAGPAADAEPTGGAR